MTDYNATLPKEIKENMDPYQNSENNDNLAKKNCITDKLGREFKDEYDAQIKDDSFLEFSLLSDEQTDILHSAFKYSLWLRKEQKFVYSFDYMVDRVRTIEKSIYSILQFDPRTIEGFDIFMEYEKKDRLQYEQLGDKFGLYPAKIFSSIAKILKDYLINNTDSDPITGKWYYESIFHNLKLLQKLPRSKLIPKLQELIPGINLHEISYFFYGNELKVKLIKNYAPYIHLIEFSSKGKKFEFAMPEGDENCMCALFYTKLTKFSEMAYISSDIIHKFGDDFFNNLNQNKFNTMDFSLSTLIERSDLAPHIRKNLINFVDLSIKYSTLYSTFYKGKLFDDNLKINNENKLLFNEIRYLKPIVQRAKSMIEKDLHLYQKLHSDKYKRNNNKNNNNISQISHNCNDVTLPELQFSLNGIKVCICCFVEQMYSNKFGKLMLIKYFMDNKDKFDIMPEMENWNNRKVKNELFELLNLNFK